MGAQGTPTPVPTTPLGVQKGTCVHHHPPCVWQRARSPPSPLPSSPGCRCPARPWPPCHLQPLGTAPCPAPCPSRCCPRWQRPAGEPGSATPPAHPAPRPHPEPPVTHPCPRHGRDRRERGIPALPAMLGCGHGHPCGLGRARHPKCLLCFIGEKQNCKSLLMNHQRSFNGSL